MVAVKVENTEQVKTEKCSDPFLIGGYSTFSPVASEGKAPNIPTFLDWIDINSERNLRGKSREVSKANTESFVTNQPVEEFTDTSSDETEEMVVPYTDTSADMIRFHNAHEDELMQFEEMMELRIYEDDFNHGEHDDAVIQHIYNLLDEGGSIFTPGEHGEATIDFAKIADKVGVSINYVEGFIDRVGFKLPKFIQQNPEPNRKDTLMKTIRLASVLSTDELSCLTAPQLELLNYIMTQDETGRFPHLQDVQNHFQFKSPSLIIEYCKQIQKSINLASEFAELRSNIQLVAQSASTLTDPQLRILKYVQILLESGEPRPKRSKRLVNYAQVAQDLGTHVSNVRKLIRSLPDRAKKINESSALDQ